MMSRILLVEGTSGVGKSTIIDALLRMYVAERPARKLRTLLHLTQAHTYGPLASGEDEGTLTVADNVAHLEALLGILEWHDRAVAAAPVSKFFAVVDTLHLTHCHRPGVVRWEDVAVADGRLAALGARMIFVRGSPQTLWDRGIVARRQSPFIEGYLARKWGGSLESIHRRFVDEQEEMRGHLARTRVPVREIDVDRPLDAYLDEAYAFWLSSAVGP